jgi:general secretion pathway protein D
MAMLFLPVKVLAGDGKKHFKEGIKQAANQQWVKAAEQFALAVADEPSNTEYQLHFHRSLINASLMMVERGDKFVEQRDYKSAYTSYRQAYGFDPSNELAVIKMRRMLEAQGLPDQSSHRSNDGASTDTVKAADMTSDTAAASSQNEPQRRLAIMDVILRNSNLLSTIEQLAQRIGLNVAFDQQVESSMKNRPISVELRDVGAAEALEIILRMTNLSYVQIGKRTILIISDVPQNRARYEQMEMRTFWIKNADVNEVRTAVMSMAGTKQAVISKQLNALTVRDTPANLEMIESIIDSFDKSKAEVLIDIKLYEVSRNALLQLGNQFRSAGDDTNPLALRLLGGFDQQLNVLGHAARTLKGPLGFALGLPASSISFFEDRGKAKLLASTQVHVLDNEQHQIRIGQRVPIKTGASTVLGSGTQTGSNPTNPSVGLNTFDNIQYENVGLNIDMQPQVFDEDIQMKMKIESSSVDRSTGELTPSFNQRTMSSVARIKNGQTTLIAGVSQSEESKQIQGIPLIGLIPIFGRFFSTPSTSNRQSDVVITVTPHILRRADIRDKDHFARDAGRGPDPSRQLTIEQILHRAERNESRQNQIAKSAEPGRDNATGSSKRTDAPLLSDSGIVTANAFSSSPAHYSAPRRGVPRVEQESVDAPGAVEQSKSSDAGSEPVKVIVRPASNAVIKDQNYYVAVTLSGDVEIASADISLGYDADIFEVREVRDGGLLGADASIQFDNPQGLLRVKINRAVNSKEGRARGILVFIVFKVKKQGRSALSLNEQETRLIMPNGQSVTLELHSSQAEAR